MLTTCAYSLLLTHVRKLYPYEYIQMTKRPTDRAIFEFTIDISCRQERCLPFNS
jgi:hypothetical protein